VLKRPSNLPRPELEKRARRAIADSGGPEVARVWYKFDCSICGERCITPDPNVLPVRATCLTCGAETTILGGGFALQTRRDRTVDWDRPANTLVVRKPYESDRGDA